MMALAGLEGLRTNLGVGDMVGRPMGTERMYFGGWIRGREVGVPVVVVRAGEDGEIEIEIDGLGIGIGLGDVEDLDGREGTEFDLASEDW